MKNIKYLIYLIISFSIISCNKFLDVNPKGETFDNDMFTSAEGYEDAIYGIYSEVANQEYLYGGYLHWIPEAMCQNINCEQVYQLANIQVQKWEMGGADKVIEQVWSYAYTSINHINNIIDHINKNGENEFRYSKLYKGEMLAMRALIHFELLRLLCPPSWAPQDMKNKTIPYVKKYSFDITPFSSFDEAYNLILEDLLEAERCLEEDEKLISTERNNIPNGFTSCRITHINLYAAQALIARVYWTLGDMDKAEEYALKVINSQKFSFRPLTSFVQPDNGTLDLHETIFGLYSERYELLNFNRYSPVSEQKSSFILASDWKKLYEEDASGSHSDYRLTAWFNSNNDALMKLVNSVFYDGTLATNRYNGKSILGNNIIRLPEMYFIVAEANIDKNPSKAVKYFDDVIITRGLEPLASENQRLTKDRLFRERRKEFYGEGITWYDMKKEGKDITTVIGTKLNGKLPSTYSIALPHSEFEGRENLK